VAPPNTFAGSTLDRAAHRRTDQAWLSEQLSDPATLALAIGQTGPLMDGDRPARIPIPPDADPVVLLGVDADGDAIFAVQLEDEPGDSLRDAVGRLSAADAGLLAYATSVLTWHRNHLFCSRCGHRTEPSDAGHVRTCPNCGATHHPRTDPVVIMLVRDDANDRVLLGRQARWPAGRYSALAGFVEPGESLEAAVAREVMEEAGVEIVDLRYRSSQPWPFPASLMIGFHADYASGEPRVADEELEDVRWFTREELQRIVSGQTDFHVPPPAAIARRLIDEWLEGR
jgi:NAD+ diphosphatase